jgi:hypothetical protein
LVILPLSLHKMIQKGKSSLYLSAIIVMKLDIRKRIVQSVNNNFQKTREWGNDCHIAP